MEFTDKIVVFIDILGFGSLVDSAARDSLGEDARRLSSALDNIEKIATLYIENDDSTISYKPHVQIFSDSVIISISPTTSNFQSLLMDLSRLFIQLMIQGVWIRGGISYGKVSTNKLSPCGPAVNTAYYIESKVASTPRIALSASIVKFCRENSEEILDSVFCERDSDGVFAVSPFRVATEKHEEFGFDIRENAHEIRDQLNRSLEDIVDRPDHFIKVNNLADRWNWIADKKKGFFKESYRTRDYIDFIDVMNGNLNDEI